MRSRFSCPSHDEVYISFFVLKDHLYFTPHTHTHMLEDNKKGFILVIYAPCRRESATEDNAFKKHDKITVAVCGKCF